MVSWDVIKNGVEWFLLMFVVVLKMSRMLLQLGVVIFVRIEALVEVVFPLHLFQCRQSPKTSALLGATGPAPHRPPMVGEARALALGAPSGHALAKSRRKWGETSQGWVPSGNLT